jgi:hypothetical protein
MALCELYILSLLFTPSVEPQSPANAAVAHFATPNLHPSMVPPGPSRGPAGGTPEPTVMLLVAGSALAYGALRRRGQKTAVPVKTEA